jgi:hypothetical protein
MADKRCNAKLPAIDRQGLRQSASNRSTNVLPAAEWLAATTGFPPTK